MVTLEVLLKKKMVEKEGGAIRTKASNLEMQWKLRRLCSVTNSLNNRRRARKRKTGVNSESSHDSTLKIIVDSHAIMKTYLH